MSDQGTATPNATPMPVFITTPPPPPPVTGQEAKPPTPLDPPLLFYNLLWRVPPILIDTQEAADALDPAEWTQNPPPPAAKAADPEFPKLFYNVNVAPQIVGDAAAQKALSGDWREFSLPEDLVKAAQAKIDAAQSTQ